MSATGSKQSQASVSRPLSAIERFDELRGRILAVLDEGSSLSDSLGSRRELISPAFRGARRSIDRSRLNLVVIGGEGHGKSTLIHGVFGTDVTPVEAVFPGTVAPVYIEWGPFAEPEFTVVCEKSDDASSYAHVEVRCKDRDEFRAYVLQRDNTGNAKRVIKGGVRLDHPLLRQGLRLVDVPGLEGVSLGISRDSREFIRMNAHAVIGVVLSRQYAPLVRLIETFILSDENDKVDDWVQAIVINVPLDEYLRVTPEAFAQRVHDWVDAGQKVLKGFKVEYDGSKMFVLHLPSVIKMRNREPLDFPEDVIRPEMKRLDETLDGYIRTNGVRTVIAQGVNLANRALTELNDNLNVRRKMLEALLGTNPEEGARIAAQFAEAAQHTRALWDRHVTTSNVRAIAEQSWIELKPKLDEKRDELLTLINDTEKKVSSYPERLDISRAREIQAELSAGITRATERTQEVIDDAVDRIVKDLCEDASNVMTHLYAAVPVLQGSSEGVKLVTVSKLISAEIGSMDEGTFDKVGRAAAVGSGALLGAKVGTAAVLAKVGGTVLATKLGIAAAIGSVGLAPIVAIPLAILGGGALGLGLYNHLRDGKKAAVLKALSECRAQIHLLDTSRESKVHKSWLAVVQSCADEVGRFLENEIQRIEALIKSTNERQPGTVDSDPADAQTDIKAELEVRRTETVGALDQVHALERRLMDIVTSADFS